MAKIDEYTSVPHARAKLGTAWLAAVGVSNWEEAASAAAFVASCLAALYTLCLTLEFVWRKWLRPFLERRGFIRRVRRRRDDPPYRRTSSDSDIDA
jgi:hypothetical protein